MSTADAHPQQQAPISRAGSALRSTATRARLLLILRASALILSLILAVVLLLTLIDYTLRFPLGVRLIVLIALLVGVFKVTTKLLLPALRTRFHPVDLALRFEHHDAASRGLLASAIDLQSTSPTNPIESALRDASLTRAAARTGNPKSLLRPASALKAIAVLVLVLAVVAIPAFTRPTLTKIGLSRTLAPWSGASWPKRFTITDTTDGSPHAIDESLRVRIAVAPSTNDAHAIIHWRVLDENNRPITETTRTLLAAQPIDADIDGRIYEQLLDTRVLADRTEDAALTLEYHIETKDDTTPKARITLARPPRLLETTITTRKPTYAQSVNPAVALAAPSTTSSDEQIITDPILVGSTTTIRWSFSKPIAFGNARPSWLESIASRLENPTLTQPTPSVLELHFTAVSPALIEPIIRDQLAISVRAPISIDLAVHTDAPPSVAIDLPERDTMVTTHAELEISAEFIDDIALAQAWIALSHAIVPTNSTGALPEPGEPIVLINASLTETDRVHPSTTLRVADFNPTPGDELWLNAHALDLLGASTNQPPVTSETRILRIVDDQTMIEHLQSSITPVQAALQRLDELQSVLQDQLHTDQLESPREQRALSEQIRTQQRIISQIERTAALNTIDDPSLRSLLHDAESILDEAADAADKAADAIDQNRDAQAEREQQTVRDRLGELLTMLDRGQDAWLARRSVQQLRDEIQRLNDETTQLGATTAGKSLAQLSPDERTTLEKILDRQRTAAERARAMLDELDERAEQLQDADPTQAEALRRAAAQGRGSQIDQTLEQATDELGNNQTGAASQSQQAAMDELDSMLDEIDHAAKNRDSALRRQLATIIDQLKSLIETQTDQLARVHSGASDLDAALIRLVRNTLAVRDTATGAFPETQTIANHLNSAADAQSLAISAFRASPADPNTAEQQQRNALQHLEQALADAERLEEQAADREARRLRNELKAKYRQALETQVIVRDATTPFINQKLTRKQRAELRALARSQEELRVFIDTLIGDSEELAEASVFVLAHAQLNTAMLRATESMSERTPPASITTNHATSIHLLSALVEVLEDAQQKEEDFEDGQSSDGGSGSGSSSGEEPLIPPIAQIKLLRSIQQLAAMQTRALSESDAPDPVSIRALIELQQEIAVQGQQLISEMSEQPGGEGAE